MHDSNLYIFNPCHVSTAMLVTKENEIEELPVFTVRYCSFSTHRSYGWSRFSNASAMHNQPPPPYQPPQPYSLHATVAQSYGLQPNQCPIHRRQQCTCLHNSREVNKSLLIYHLKYQTTSYYLLVHRACPHHPAPECRPHIHTANPRPTQWAPTAPFSCRAGRPRCPIPKVLQTPKTHPTITFTIITTTTASTIIITTRTTKDTPTTATTAPHPRPTLPVQRRPISNSDTTRIVDDRPAAVCSTARSSWTMRTRMCRQR